MYGRGATANITNTTHIEYTPLSYLYIQALIGVHTCIPIIKIVSANYVALTEEYDY